MFTVEIFLLEGTKAICLVLMAQQHSPQLTTYIICFFHNIRMLIPTGEQIFNFHTCVKILPTVGLNPNSLFFAPSSSSTLVPRNKVAKVSGDNILGYRLTSATQSNIVASPVLRQQKQQFPIPRHGSEVVCSGSAVSCICISSLS